MKHPNAAMPRGRQQKQAIANRNEQASKVAREKRQARDDKHAAALRAADKRERAELAKRKP